MADQAPIQRLFLYEEGEPTLEDLASLTLDQLNKLSDFVDRAGFFGAEPREVLDLATNLGLSYEKTLDLLRFAGFIDAERARIPLAPDDLVAEFQTYLTRRNLPNLLSSLPRIRDGLIRLFRDRPELAFRAKIRSVTSGIVPSAIDFHSLCDLRPVFNEQRDAVLEYVPVALVRVQVRNDLREDSALIFQIDQKALAQMEKFMERLKRKLSVLEEVREKLMGGKK